MLIVLSIVYIKGANCHFFWYCPYSLFDAPNGPYGAQFDL